MYDFAPPMQAPAGSPIRELFKYLSLPGMISFAGGYPSPSLFDTEGLAAAQAMALCAQPVACLQYGPTEGVPALRQALAQLMTGRGAEVAAEEVMVTTGSQQAFELVVKAFIEPGALAIVEEPTYPAALQALRLAGATLRAVESDADGMCIDRLEHLLASLPPGQRPRLIYTVPTFANPTGATLSLPRRLALLQLATRYQVVVVEDDPYGDLRFRGEAIPSLLALTRDIPEAKPWVVHMGSLSKLVAPGLRLGWMVAPADILRRATIAKQVSDLCTSPWLQLAGASYLDAGHLPAQLERILAAYRSRCERLVTGLRATFGSHIRFSAPEGGMFLWATLDGITDSAALLPSAVEERILFVPGVGFHTGPGPHVTFRLSFAMPTEDEIDEGVRRLGRAVARHLAEPVAG